VTDGISLMLDDISFVRAGISLMLDDISLVTDGVSLMTGSISVVTQMDVLIDNKAGIKQKDVTAKK